ncbi:MAG: hypothetical protein R3293_25520 [Candidatus Promineifilaceae bacterium]|nr:hypothetical protein [Candidatus Promineifilaceae bacterium]
MKPHYFKLRLDAPASYRIRLQGVLSKSWSDRLSGMQIKIDQEPGQAPVTTLTGELIDQAALCSVLNAVYNLGLPLLSVECMDENRQE